MQKFTVYIQTTGGLELTFNILRFALRENDVDVRSGQVLVQQFHILAELGEFEIIQTGSGALVAKGAKPGENFLQRTIV